jgi:Rrf2 family nitric oxide-sensitive transcriptional repressor
MLNQTVEYALRAVIYIARDPSASLRAAEVAVGIRAPRNYVAKILSQLVRAGILESVRGPTGGFRLAKTPNAVPLADVVAAFGRPAERRCLLGHGVCGTNPSCGAHRRWDPIAKTLDCFVDDTTIADMLSTAHSL